MNIVPDSDFSDRDKQLIVNEVGNKLADGFRVSVNLVDKLRQTKSGKTPYLVQEFRGV